VCVVGSSRRGGARQLVSQECFVCKTLVSCVSDFVGIAMPVKGRLNPARVLDDATITVG
jgi:hypothetical protein